ncbi:MAG: ATP-binding cassette domain-containing protein [Patescibacteria group bacterium]|nr:ATP-binding cassette domain-containing protein [Patescibacteria group bacterium]
MKRNIAIKVTNLGKKYKIGGREAYLTLRDMLTGLIGSNRLNKSFWALKEVSFEVRKGEMLGVIGANGAGKSTLLKLLSQITELSSGEMLIRGRIRSLLELGVGFNSELTGKENIFLNGVILGMKRKEVRGKLKQIVGLAGIEKFMDTPTKYFSSGMFIRMGISVLFYTDFDILIIDEILAAVDKRFQDKVFVFLEDQKRQGKTIILVSHNLELVRKHCQKVILLEKGRIKKFGEANKVIDCYLTKI